MIISLQKRHRQIWTALAIVLPVLFILSYFSTSERLMMNEKQDYSLLPVIFKEREHEYFKIIERKLERENDIQYQMQVIVKKPLNEITALIYILEKEKVKDHHDHRQFENKQPIGQIFSKGSYSFDPLQGNDKIVFYNPQTKKVFYMMD